MAEGPTRGQRRAAITKFCTLIKQSWDANRQAFAHRFPGFALFSARLEKLRLRVGKDGGLLFEPGYALENDTRIEKLEDRIERLERLADGDESGDTSTRVDDETDESEE